MAIHCSISCLNTFLEVRFPAETCLSRGALVEDGDDLGQISV